MGKKQETVEDVPCGNTVALFGLDQFITKNATLTNEKEVDAHPIRLVKFSLSVVVQSGEHVTAGAGNFHLDMCFNDLLNNLTDIAGIIKSDPVVSFRETVLEKSSQTVMSMSPNKHNRLYMQARPLEEGLSEAIDSGQIGPSDDPKVRSKILSEEFGWDKDLAKKI
ncbi:hypothetical protein FXO38_32758 [Capsicum annuum]|nr:hypothetical protein FXO38_32758 [Capsicum annuum]